MHFADLIHQPAGLAQLRELAATDRLPHANLLLSPPGAGGLPGALAVASLMLCENRQGDAPCGRCRACRKTGGRVHPDLHFVFPTVGSRMTSDPFLPQWREALANNPYLEANDWLQHIGAENRQGNITRESCASLLNKLNLKIFEGRYKVMLIWLPEYLGNEGNRLLKVIEEPPENTVFLLVAERLESILPTILSRCQLTKLLPPNEEEIARALTARGIPGTRARATARLADGNFAQALDIADRDADHHGKLLTLWLRACYKGSALMLAEWIEQFVKLGREDQKHFLQYCLHFWREFLLLSVGEEAARLPPEEKKLAAKLRPLIGHEQLHDIVSLVNDCAEYVERNANPRILMMDASLRTHQIIRQPPRAAANPRPAAARA